MISTYVFDLRTPWAGLIAASVVACAADPMGPPVDRGGIDVYVAADLGMDGSNEGVVDSAGSPTDAAIGLDSLEAEPSLDAMPIADGSIPRNCVCEPGTYADGIPCPESPYLLPCRCNVDGVLFCRYVRDPTCAGSQCHDGSQISCCGGPPTCPEGSDVAVLGGCWECVDVTTCEPVSE